MRGFGHESVPRANAIFGCAGGGVIPFSAKVGARMIVPNFWAESRVRHRADGRQRTVRRFGWSDVSQEAAQAHAERRAAEALTQVLAGAAVPSSERKVAYNGAEGVPIREEVVSRHGEGTVVTRNAYGARCLNTDRALFVDIDFGASPLPGCGAVVVSSVLSYLVASRLLEAGRGWSLGFAAGLVVTCAVLAYVLRRPLERWLSMRDERRAHKRIHDFIAKNPGWHLRLYRTPAGLRALAMHRAFNAGDAEVHECFTALGADPLYAQMCRNQGCFRARVSGKPWRMGLTQRLRPRPGVWPVKPEWLPLRASWVEHYEREAASYAACRFIGAVGSELVDPDIAAVQVLHDALSGSDSILPLA
jgi:hypothetical protein